MKKFKSLILFIGFLLISIFFILQFSAPKYTTVEINDVKVKAEVADTVSKRIKGLMFRNSLKENEGMLFLFDSEDYHSFWMMNTTIHLDIIWINSSKHVVYIQKNAEPCKVTNCQVYKPTEKAKYVLEVNAGFSDKYKIEIGDEVGF